MKMAKATKNDIDAAGDAMSVLQDISSGHYPTHNDDGEDPPYRFDPDKFDHLRKFYDMMDDKTLEALTTLANKLGTTAEYLWGVLIKQAPITGAIELSVTPAKVRSTDELGAVLTYEDCGGPGACGQTVGADGRGWFSVLFYGRPDNAHRAAGEYLRTLRAAGRRIKSECVVTNENSYSGPNVRTVVCEHVVF